MGTAYNPLQVMMGNPGKTGTPYTGVTPPRSKGLPVFAGNVSGSGSTANPPSPTPTPAPTAAPAAPQGNVVGPEAVRATGTGPFDSAYRQDLATYAGGLFARPGGNLSFNPTSNSPFGGAATGGGNAPVLGMPNTLLQNALGGNPFSYTPPTPAANTLTNPNFSMQQWMNQFLTQGGLNTKAVYQ
jgi:hypothetical protein